MFNELKEAPKIHKERLTIERGGKLRDVFWYSGTTKAIGTKTLWVNSMLRSFREPSVQVMRFQTRLKTEVDIAERYY